MGQDRGGFGTPSNLERKLGVYLPTKGKTSALKQGRRGVTVNVGAGIAGEQPKPGQTIDQEKHVTTQLHKISGGSGFTRIRPEDKLETRKKEEIPDGWDRSARVRKRKAREPGYVRSGGLKRLRRKLNSKNYAADREQLKSAITRTKASGSRRLKRGFSNLPEEK